MNKKTIKSIVITAVLGLGVATWCPLNAAIFTEEEINVEMLLKALSRKFNASKSENGKWVVVKNEGVKMSCILEPKQKLLVLRIGFTAGKDNRAKKLELCNRYNDEKVVARFSVDKDGDFTIDCFMPYDGGMNTVNVYEQISWMYSVTRDFLKSVKEEKIISED